jgi:hypothetical protein
LWHDNRPISGATRTGSGATQGRLNAFVSRRVNERE